MKQENKLINANLTISKLQPVKRVENNSTNLRGNRAAPANNGACRSVQGAARNNNAQQQTTNNFLLGRRRATSTNNGCAKPSRFDSYTISRQMDKKQRFSIYIRRLAASECVGTPEQVIDLLNATMNEIEDKYAPNKENKFYAVNSKRYGRMHPIPQDRIKLNEQTGVTELLSVGLVTYIYPNGSFEIWTVPRGLYKPKLIFQKKGSIKDQQQQQQQQPKEPITV
jgi:hypothetical protein